MSEAIGSSFSEERPLSENDFAKGSPDQPVDTSASGSASAEALDALRQQYQHSRTVLLRWLVAGGVLLLAGLGLWQWGPRKKLTVLTPGYTFHQAGTVQGAADTTWVWVLADTAQRARVLLSYNQGVTWLVRDLGLSISRARALALGWGQSGRGLLVGDGGQIRILADVLRHPQQGQDGQISATARDSLFAVAVDSSGQRAVVLGRQTAVWTTRDAGQTWLAPRAKRFAARPGIRPTIAIAAPGGFLLAAPDSLFWLLPAPPANLENENVTLSEGVGWGQVRNRFGLVPVWAQVEPSGNCLFVAANGAAERFYPGGIMGNRSDGSKVESRQLFSAVPPAIALVIGTAARKDGSLLFANAPRSGGGQVYPVSVATDLFSRPQQADAYQQISADSTAAAVQEQTFPADATANPAVQSAVQSTTTAEEKR